MDYYSIQFMAEQRIADLQREAEEERLAQAARLARAARHSSHSDAHVSPVAYVRQAIARLVSIRPTAPAAGSRCVECRRGELRP